MSGRVVEVRYAGEQDSVHFAVHVKITSPASIQFLLLIFNLAPFFFLGGKGRECFTHHNAGAPCVGLSPNLAPLYLLYLTPGPNVAQTLTPPLRCATSQFYFSPIHLVSCSYVYLESTFGSEYVFLKPLPIFTLRIRYVVWYMIKTAHTWKLANPPDDILPLPHTPMLHDTRYMALLELVIPSPTGWIV